MSKSNSDYIKLLEKIRWDNQPKCPYCGSDRATKIKKEHRYHCNNCFTSYSVTVNTFLHKTRIDLKKWFLAIRLFIEMSDSISARKLALAIQVNKNTAAHILRRIRQSISEDSDFFQRIVDNIKRDKEL